MSYVLLPELSLAVACCRWPFKSDHQEDIRERARRVGDWDRFELIVQRNRVGSLACHALLQSAAELPRQTQERLSRRALAAAQRSLIMARESVLLQQAFERAGIPVMIVKGAPLAVLAYGQIGMKESWDIDLLTSSECVAEAGRLLAHRGYQNALERLKSRQLEAFLRVSKEAEFTHPVTGLTVELHWSLIDDRHLLRGVGAEGSAQYVATAAGPLRTIADEELFAYLCLHGAVHNWSRLKWLADLGAWISQRDEAELQRLYRTSEGYRAGRAASVALLLCSHLLDHKFDEEFLNSLRRRQINRYLERNVLACLAYRSGVAEHRRYTAPWIRTIVAQFLFAPGALHVLEQVRMILNPPIDRLESPLPSGLDFLYPFIRIPLWIARTIKRIARPLRAYVVESRTGRSDRIRGSKDT